MHQIDTTDLQFLQERYGEIKGWVPGAVKKGKVNPQVTMAHLGGNTFVSVFHVKPVYYETPTGHWRPLSEVTAYHGNHSIVLNENWWKVHPRYLNWLDKRCKLINGQLLITSPVKSYPTPYAGVVRSLHESLVPLKIGLTTSTFYPDPNAETTSVDGGTATLDSLTTWATVHADTTGQYPNDSGAEIQDAGHGVIGIQTYGSTNDFNICRGFILFDTSAIADTDTIDSGTLSIYYSAKFETLASGADAYIGYVSSNPASNTAIAATDIDTLGTTEYCSGNDITGISTAAYTDNALNATGISAVSKTGVTKIGMRVGYDLNNNNPGWSGSKNVGCRAYSADTSGTSSDPKLVIVHTASAAAFVPKISFFS